MHNINYERHIWEGWCVIDFIRELEPLIEIEQLPYASGPKLKSIQNREELKKWCMDNQPYFKGHIPEVVDYFAIKLNIK